MKDLIIITTDSGLSNYRAKKIFQLKHNFSSVTILSRYGKPDNNAVIVGSYPNPFGILKALGLIKLKRLLDRLFYFPNSDILFFKKAFKELSKIIEQKSNKHETVLLAIAPPHINALLGYRIKLKNPEISLVIDWQDLWSYDEYHLAKSSKIYQSKLKGLERKILSVADKNIVTNEYAAEVLNMKYNINSAKIFTIYHPYDESELVEKILPGQNIDEKIKIGFLGHLIKPPKVKADRLFSSIIYCQENGLGVELNIYGDEQEITKKFIKNSQCKTVRLHPKVSHEESLNLLKHNNFLVVTLEDLPNSKIIMHGKLSHYLQMGIPIIAFVPKGSYVQKLISDTKSGYVIESDNGHEDAMYRIIIGHNKNAFNENRNIQEISKYSWGNISNLWLRVLS